MWIGEVVGDVLTIGERSESHCHMNFMRSIGWERSSSSSSLVMVVVWGL